MRRDEDKSLKNNIFDRFLHEIWVIAQESSTAPEAAGLPLNTPSKELVDQACLIDYAGCDESLNVQAVWPYGALFVLICMF